MKHQIIFHPLARLELFESKRWYAEKSLIALLKFQVEVTTLLSILEEEKKSVARVLEYEHINAFIKNQSKPPFMNREFHNPLRRDDSLSTLYMNEYNQRNTLVQFFK